MSLKIGLIGTGWFGEKHAKLLSSMSDVQVTGIVGTSKDKAEHLASQLPDATGYAELEHMLDAQKLDAVYISVPPFAHGALELQLVERGIPFFVEKPLSVDLETASKVLDAVNRTQLLTSVGYHFRYYECRDLAKERLANQTLGMALGYWTGGMPGVSWWRQAQGSGGQFVEQTTHIVDLLRDLAGEVVEVYAAYANRYQHLMVENVSVPDVGTVTLKLRSGAVATISNTCMLPIGHTTGLHLYTETGVMELSQGGLKELGAARTTEHYNRADPYERETAAFLHALRTGDRSGIRSDYADAWRTQQVTTAANRSAELGQPIRLE